jgi:hypothetical protein
MLFGASVTNPARLSDPGWLLIVVFVPFSTFMMATYDGMLFALLVVTCLLPALGLVDDRRHKVRHYSSSAG